MKRHVYPLGSIIYCDFDPSAGHEQNKRRPALVISDNEYQQSTGFHVVCPITHTDKGYPTRVKLDERTNINGFVAAEQFKSLDLDARKAEWKEMCPQDILNAVLFRAVSAFPNTYYQPDSQ